MCIKPSTSIKQGGLAPVAPPLFLRPCTVYERLSLIMKPKPATTLDLFMNHCLLT